MSDTSHSGTAALCGSLLGLTTVAVALRFHARSQQKVAFKMDDWIMIPTWAFFVALTADMFYGMSKKMVGYNQPYSNGKPLESYTFIAIFFILDVISVLSLGTAKLSGLFFYRRIFCAGHRRDAFDIITWMFIALISLYTTLYFIMCFTLCVSHINGHWTIEGRKTCPDLLGFLQAIVYTDVVFEFLVLILPIPRIWALHLPARRRVAICGVFLLATIGFISSCVRLAAYLHLNNLDGEDLYRANTRWAFFTVLEAGFTIIAVNLPSLWYYTVNIDPERVLQSVRSILSLRSQSSGSTSSTEERRNSQSSRQNEKRRHFESAPRLHAQVGENCGEDTVTQEFYSFKRDATSLKGIIEEDDMNAAHLHAHLPDNSVV